MPEASFAITTEYVRCFLALMGRGFFWPEAVLDQLAVQGLDPLDVTYVLTHGDVVETDKETADGTIFVMIGRTCDDVRIRVKFWADVNQMNLRILQVTLV